MQRSIFGLALAMVLGVAASAAADNYEVCAVGQRGSTTEPNLFYCTWSPAPSRGENAHQIQCLWTVRDERGHAFTVWAVGNVYAVWVPVHGVRVRIRLRPNATSCDTPGTPSGTAPPAAPVPADP